MGIFFQLDFSFITHVVCPHLSSFASTMRGSVYEAKTMVSSRTSSFRVINVITWKHHRTFNTTLLISITTHERLFSQLIVQGNNNVVAQV